ncbi:unnamed protein product [Hyaloperonospora brassicae]|uniref:Uncharacterized protein n=1 Tax=Hyaloperonospora brassicae TaxID=162125 RepID=A0AAV0TAT5_HYABA|nr:unnamed protein product [Hyaloperonospora brassicae]
MISEDAATRAAKRKHATSGGRKLLHWGAAHWQLFERTLPYTTCPKSAPLLHLRASLASIRKSHAPSVVMEQPIGGTRSVSVLNLGLVIDATGSVTCLHDVKEKDGVDVQYVNLKVYGSKDEEMGPEVHDNRLAEAFCTTLFGHLKGDGWDMDMAVFWGGWLKLCGVPRCALFGRTLRPESRRFGWRVCSLDFAWYLHESLPDGTEGGGIPGKDGSISEQQLVQYIENISS